MKPAPGISLVDGGASSALAPIASSCAASAMLASPDAVALPAVDSAAAALAPADWGGSASPVPGASPPPAGSVVVEAASAAAANSAESPVSSCAGATSYPQESLSAWSSAAYTAWQQAW